MSSNIRISHAKSTCYPVVVPSRTPTRAEVVFTRLRRDILTGKIAPGTKLPAADLCDTYDASIGVTREALSRLCELGLVVAEAQIGYRVMPLSIEALEDLTLARCEIEGAALSLSVQHGDLAWESAVVASHYALERTAIWQTDGERLVNLDWESAHAAFHKALLAACPSPRLVNVASSLRDAAELYRLWSGGGLHPGPHVSLDTGHRDVGHEHCSIKDAALDRDHQAASDLLRAHLRTTADLLRARISAGLLPKSDDIAIADTARHLGPSGGRATPRARGSQRRSARRR
jgi:DNA-binding GntR family transcriptional regulator